MFNYLLFEANPYLLIFIWIIFGFLSGYGIYLLVKIIRYLKECMKAMKFKIDAKKNNLTVCKNCSGFGSKKNRGGGKWDCEVCNGRGVLDWPQKIKNGIS